MVPVIQIHYSHAISRCRTWRLLEHPRAHLHTSYYGRAERHNRVTRRRSHHLTRANIAEAMHRGIPIHLGIIDLGHGVGEAEADLRELGVTDIGSDRLRRIGRGATGTPARPDELCGHCAEARLAIMPDGAVHPCIMSRWMTVGNVRETSLIAINHAAERGARREPAAAFANGQDTCIPTCQPGCHPQTDRTVDASTGRPCIPSGTPPCPPMIQCGPAHSCAPNHDGRCRL